MILSYIKYKLGKSDLIFYVNGSIIISIKRVGGATMIHEELEKMLMPKFYLKLDEVEWKIGLRAGYIISTDCNEPFEVVDSEAFRRGALAGYKLADLEAKKGD